MALHFASVDRSLRRQRAGECRSTTVMPTMPHSGIMFVCSFLSLLVRLPLSGCSPMAKEFHWLDAPAPPAVDVAGECLCVASAADQLFDLANALG